MHERLSRFGAKLGNWNDAHRYDKRSKVLDRIAGWLYTLPDRRR